MPAAIGEVSDRNDLKERKDRVDDAFKSESDLDFTIERGYYGFM